MRHLLALALTTIVAVSLHARKAEEVTPLLIGSPTPKITLVDEKGVEQYLPALLKGKRSILVFYRGGWCPYCSTQMQELAQAESELLELGYQIIGISPDSPEMLGSVEKEGELPYTLLSDSSVEAAKAFGIDFQLAKTTLVKYEGYGIDLGAASGGKNKDLLPVPSVFIVSPDNKIAFSYVNPDYRVRIPGDLLLAAAKAAKK